MCRIAAYAGPPAPLSALLFDGPHSLEHQAYAPRELLHGALNVDGTGVAWWDGNDSEPIRYTTAQPPWGDANLVSLAPRIRSAHQLATVRSATRGLPFGAASVAPFVAGALAGAHNGRINGFRGGVGRDLVARLEPELFARLQAFTDSNVLFLLVAQHASGGEPLRTAVATTLSDVRSVLEKHGETATLNLVVGDGTTFVAARHSVGGPANSLYCITDGQATVVASEPHDDRSGWVPVPEGHVIEFTAGTTTVHPMEGAQ